MMSNVVQICHTPRVCNIISIWLKQIVAEAGPLRFSQIGFRNARLLEVLKSENKDFNDRLSAISVPENVVCAILTIYSGRLDVAHKACFGAAAFGEIENACLGAKTGKWRLIHAAHLKHKMTINVLQELLLVMFKLESI